MSAPTCWPLRYPEDLFKVQRDILAQLPRDRRRAFYSGQDFWQVPDDPTQRAANRRSRRTT